MYRYLALLLIVACLDLSCRKVRAGEDLERLVSMISLISHPAASVGSRVLVKGYLSDNNGVPTLYLTRNHARIEDSMTGFAIVNWRPGECDDSWVALSARFARGAPSGEYHFEQVERVVRLDEDGFARECFSNASFNGSNLVD